MNDYELWNMARHRQAELLKEAETERMLRQVGWVKSTSLTVKLLLAACLCLPFALLFVRMVVATGRASLI